MELETDSNFEKSSRSVNADSNLLQQLNTEGQNGCQDLGLGLDQVVGISPLLGAAHNPTSEVSWASMLASEKTVMNNQDENSALEGPEPNILPLIDVGLGRPPITDFLGDNVSSLSVIANYGTSSESDSDSYSDTTRYFEPSNIVASTPAVICSNPPVDYRTTHGSSSDDSESESESSEDESSSSGSSSDHASRNAKVAATNLVVKKNVPVTKGEVTLDDLPPIEDLHISVPEDACVEIGSISSIVDQQVVIQAKKGLPAMDLGTVLFLEKGKHSLGEIFDVFGQVTEPFYSVRFNSAEHIQKKGIEKGMSVFCAPQTEHTNYVFLQELLQLKGTDASWEDNNEPPPQCIDYSDDEEERTSLRTKRNVDKGDHGDADFELIPRKRVNSFERRMNERNLRKSALIQSETRRGALGRAVDLGGARRQVVRPFVNSPFGWSQCGRGRGLNVGYGVPPMQHPIGSQRMGQPMNYGPMQAPSLSLPPQPNSFGPIQPPSHAMPPPANGHPCGLMGVRPNGPPTEYRSTLRQQPNLHPPNLQPPSLQPPNLQPSNLQPTLHPPTTNTQPMGYVPAPIRFSYIPPGNMMDNSDGQYPQYGVLGFMSPQAFQNRPRNLFSSPPPGFPPVPGFNRVRPRSFPALYGQLPPMFYPEFQPPQLPPGAMPNALASLFSRPPPPNGGV